MSDSLKSFIKLFMSQTPMLAVGLAYTQGFIHDPLIAAGLAVLSEIMGLVIAFGRKVWEVLEPEAVQGTANGVKHIFTIFTSSAWVEIQNRFNRFRRRYNKQLYYDHRFFNTSGLKTKGGAILELVQVFVELRIAPSDMQQASMNPVEFKALSGQHSIWAFLSRLHSVNAVAIIGAPGSGKTTMLQHVALTLAYNRQRQYGLKAYTPLFLFLREHVQAICGDNPPTLAELAQSYFSDPKRYPDLHPPTAWFDRQLDAGNCLVLLDGLDEVAQVAQRQIVSSWVDEQIRHYPDSRFILTARPQGYRDAPLQRAHVLQVLPFTPHQVEQFVQNWYLATKIHQTGQNDAGVRRDAAQEANDLLRRVWQTPNLSDLTVNPLLLTMMALVHNYRGTLPGGRVGLYHEICDVFLEHWQQAKKLHDRLTAAQKRVALQPLAAFMMAQKSDTNRRRINTEAALTLMEPYLQKVGLLLSEYELFLDQMRGNGLLLEVEVGQWQFAHLTFQEYLCASHWVQYPETIPAPWPELLQDSWWHEALRLYAAQTDATSLVQTCLELNQVITLTMATYLMEEAKELTAAVRQTVQSVLENYLESPDPALRQLAAEVKLNRRLKTDFQRLDDHRSIGKTLVTCAEYQLFLDEAFKAKIYHQPDHWADYVFSAGQANQPIVGIWPADAKAFCAWLSQHTGQNYRLPHETELIDFKGNLPLNLTIWLDTGKLYPLSTQILLQALNQLNTSTLPQPISLDFSNTRIRDIYLDRKLVLGHNRELVLVLDLILARGRKPVFERVHNLVRDIDLKLDRDFILDRDLITDRNLIMNGDRDRCLALAHLLAHEMELDEEVVICLERNNFTKAYQLVMTQLADDLTEMHERSLRLLEIAIQIAQVDDFITWRFYQWQLACLTWEYIYIGSEILAKDEKQPWWQFWCTVQSKQQTRQEEYLQLYWLFHTLRLRSEGKLPAWEGLLLVREG